jgi:hypothetical protein
MPVSAVENEPFTPQQYFPTQSVLRIPDIDWPIAIQGLTLMTFCNQEQILQNLQKHMIFHLFEIVI